jgi:hypothetical protein
MLRNLAAKSCSQEGYVVKVWACVLSSLSLSVSLSLSIETNFVPKFVYRLRYTNKFCISLIGQIILAKWWNISFPEVRKPQVCIAVSPHEDNQFLWAKSRKKNCTGGDTGTAVTLVVLLQGSEHSQWCVALYFQLNNSYYVRVWNYPHYTIASFWLLVLRTPELYEMFPLRYTRKLISLRNDVKKMSLYARRNHYC